MITLAYRGCPLRDAPFFVVRGSPVEPQPVPLGSGAGLQGSTQRSPIWGIHVVDTCIAILSRRRACFFSPLQGTAARPSFMPLFTQVRGRLMFGSSCWAIAGGIMPTTETLKPAPGKRAGREEQPDGPANRTGGARAARAAGRRMDPRGQAADGPPWPGEARATIEWHDSGAHLVVRSTVEMPEAPDSISIIGCDARTGPTSSSTPTSVASAASTR
jgi:hypothetical protein